ncbi:hypothetical protein ACUN90_27940, partial [Escherichia sp. SP-MK2]
NGLIFSSSSILNFIFKGTSLNAPFFASDYGICMVERPVIPTAEQEVEHIEVSGRHGSLTKKGAFKDVPLKIKFNMFYFLFCCRNNRASYYTYSVVTCQLIIDTYV